MSNGSRIPPCEILVPAPPGSGGDDTDSACVQVGARVEGEAPALAVGGLGGGRAATAAAGGVLSLRDARGAELDRRRLSSEVTALAVLRARGRRRLLAAGTLAGDVTLWEVVGRRLQHRATAARPADGERGAARHRGGSAAAVTAVVPLGGGGEVAVAEVGGAVRWWRVAAAPDGAVSCETAAAAAGGVWRGPAGVALAADPAGAADRCCWAAGPGGAVRLRWAGGWEETQYVTVGGGDGGGSTDARGREESESARGAAPAVLTACLCVEGGGLWAGDAAGGLHLWHPAAAGTRAAAYAHTQLETAGAVSALHAAPRRAAAVWCCQLDGAVTLWTVGAGSAPPLLVRLAALPLSYPPPRRPAVALSAGGVADGEQLRRLACRQPGSTHHYTTAVVAARCVRLWRCWSAATDGTVRTWLVPAASGSDGRGDSSEEEEEEEEEERNDQFREDGQKAAGKDRARASDSGATADSAGRSGRGSRASSARSGEAPAAAGDSCSPELLRERCAALERENTRLKEALTAADARAAEAAALAEELGRRVHSGLEERERLWLELARRGPDREGREHTSPSASLPSGAAAVAPPPPPRAPALLDYYYYHHHTP